jgi:hypothetical protein
MKRRCNWLGFLEGSGGAPVWARKDVSVDSCPKSYVTGDSQARLEEFLVLRRIGGLRPEELSARQVEAFAILENEMTREVNHAQHESRPAV